MTAGGDFSGLGPAAPCAEVVIQTDDRELHVLADAFVEARKYAHPLEVHGVGAEAHVAVFDRDRPIGRDHPIETGTRKPAATGHMARGSHGRRGLDKFMLVVRKGGATPDEDQQRRLGEKAHAAGSGGKPRYPRRKRFAEKERILPAHIRPIEHALGAEDPRSALDIATELSAAEEIG